MSRLLPILLLVVAATAVPTGAQTNPSFTGKWEGTFTLQRPDGTEGQPSAVVFDLTQKGKALTGKAGPPNQQLDIAKGAVDAGKATFEVPTPSGPIFKFNLSIVKGRLQGEMTREVDGALSGRAKVDAGKAK